MKHSHSGQGGHWVRSQPLRLEGLGKSSSDKEGRSQDRDGPFLTPGQEVQAMIPCVAHLQVPSDLCFQDREGLILLCFVSQKKEKKHKNVPEIQEVFLHGSSGQQFLGSLNVKIKEQNAVSSTVPALD